MNPWEVESPRDGSECGVRLRVNPTIHGDYHDEVAHALIAIGDPELGEAIRKDRGSQLVHFGIRFPELRPTGRARLLVLRPA
jgi:hypothetical protein